MVLAGDDLNSGGSISRGPSEGLRMLQKESKGGVGKDLGRGGGMKSKEMGLQETADQACSVQGEELLFSMRRLITAMVGAPWDKQAEMQLKHKVWLILPIYLLVEVYLGS